MTSFSFKPLALSACTLESCLGSGLDDTWYKLRDGISGLTPCDFETADLHTYIGRVQGLEDEPLMATLDAYDCRNNRLALRALREETFFSAVAAARARYGARRIGVFAGTSTAGLHDSELAFRRLDPATGALPPDFRYRGAQNTHSIATFTQQVLALEGPAMTVSAACASTAKTFAVAARLIALGWCDAAVVGGADSLCLTTLYGFNALQLTAPNPCRPFDVAREGLSIGEAAGFVLLERADHASTSADTLLLGVGESSDAHHLSAPHPEGLGALQAMRSALAMASLSPDDIDYVNLHGTATRTGDVAEDCAVATLFGQRTPCSSTKGLTGHTLGAAGVVEALLAMLSLRHGYIPPSPTTGEIDPEFRSHYLAAGGSLPLSMVMSNSFGFGGSNCSLILGRRT